MQQDKKVQAEQRAIQQTHGAISKALASAQRNWSEEEQTVLETCRKEQESLKQRLTGVSASRSDVNSGARPASLLNCVAVLRSRGKA